jgi:hypothetical protein
LLIGLALGFVYMVRYWRHDRRALPLWALVSLLLLVMLPTEVHERYLLLVLPFLGVCAALTWRMWPGLLLLLIVMMGQLSWPLWLRSGRGQWPEIRAGIVKQVAADLAAQPGDSEQKKQLADQFLSSRYQSYRDLHRTTAVREWALTLCALLGTATVLAAVGRLQPRASPSGSLRPGQCRSL